MKKPDSVSEKFVHVWFEIFQSYLGRRKETSGNISQPWTTASASKTFPSVPFYLPRQHGKISNQTWTNFSSDVARTIIETKYSYSFLFINIFILHHSISFEMFERPSLTKTFKEISELKFFHWSPIFQRRKYVASLILFLSPLADQILGMLEISRLA